MKPVLHRTGGSGEVSLNNIKGISLMNFGRLPLRSKPATSISELGAVFNRKIKKDFDYSIEPKCARATEGLVQHCAYFIAGVQCCIVVFVS